MPNGYDFVESVYFDGTTAIDTGLVAGTAHTISIELNIKDGLDAIVIGDDLVKLGHGDSCGYYFSRNGNLPANMRLKVTREHTVFEVQHHPSYSIMTVGNQ